MSADWNDKNLSPLYADFRPSYPNYIIQKILSTCREKWSAHEGDNQRKALGGPKTGCCLQNLCAIDVGCGSGIFTRLIAPYFKKVIAIDISDTQLASARKVQQNGTGNIDYIKLDVYDIDKLLEDKVVQVDEVCLITIAETLHWLDIPKLMQLLRDTFSKNVIIVPVAYVSPDIMNDDASSHKFPVLNPELRLQKYGKEYWLSDKHWKECLETLRPGHLGETSWMTNYFSDCGFDQFFKNINFEGVSVIKQTNLYGFRMFVESLYLYKSYLSKNKDGLAEGEVVDPVQKLMKKILEEFHLHDRKNIVDFSSEEDEKLMKGVEIHLQWNYFYYTLCN